MSSTRRRKRAVEDWATTEVVIERLGDQGDGIGRRDGRRVAVPGALPGERHRVRFDRAAKDQRPAQSLDVLESRPRATPICRHFDRCGGCVTQHVPEVLERTWKQRRIEAALGRRGLEATVHPGHVSALASRRRIRVAVGRAGNDLTLGFRARRRHAIVDLEMCPIAQPELVAALTALRPTLKSLSELPKEVELTAYPAGVELVVGGRERPRLGDRERLVDAAVTLDLARVAWRTGDEPPEPLVERRRPLLPWPGLAVAPPPGAFLQATADGEAYLQGSVRAAVTAGYRVADLFAGVGTLSAAALEGGAHVTAFEQDAAALGALADGGAAVEARRRDLQRHPLAPDELATFDTVVLDPPRRGAEAQARSLAASPVPRVVYASCAPLTFARDAAILEAGGYRLKHVALVDQFRFASEVELIAVFGR